MDSLKNNKLFWVVIVLTVFNVGAYFIGKVVIDKVTDRVIQRLQKEYSPSPYGPGLDPDKVSPEALKATKQYFETRKTKPSAVFHDESLRGGWEPETKAADDWRAEWEKSRGANPE